MAAMMDANLPTRTRAGLRIAYLSPCYFDDHSQISGIARYPLNLARGVVESARGTCTVDILACAAHPREQAVAPGVTLRLLPAAGAQPPWDMLSGELPAAIAGADLVHIHQAAVRFCELGLLFAKQQRKPVCVTDHGSIQSAAGVFADRLDLADRVVCYSDYGASLLVTRTPIDIIKGGVDGRFFTPPAVARARDRVLYVGRIVPHKGIDRLIAALPPELPLTVCGRPYHDYYFNLLKQQAQSKKVEFIHDAGDEQLRDLYQRAWVTVLPTVSQDCAGSFVPAAELMGLVLLESMACGTPVLCSTTGGMPEFVQSGETGFVYHDLNELTDKLRYLAGNPSTVEQLGRRGRQVVEMAYDLRTAGAQLLGVYQRLMARCGLVSDRATAQEAAA